MNTKISKKLFERFGAPIGDYQGEQLVGVRDERKEETCQECGMVEVDGRCGCDDVCPMCGMMSPQIEGGCGCEISSKEDLLFPYEETKSEDLSKETCACGAPLGVCTCCMNESINEVTPKGYEKIVKTLKKKKAVKNPWAVAWYMKGQGIKPKKR